MNSASILPSQLTLPPHWVAEIILAVVVFAIIFGIAPLIHYYRVQQQKREGRLAAFVALDEKAEAELMARDASEQASLPLGELFNRSVRRQAFAAQYRTDLQRAGLTVNVGEWVAVNIGAGIVLFLIVLAAALGSNIAAPTALLMGLLAFALCFLAGHALLRVLQRRRVTAFEAQLNDAIDVMRGALDAGSSLPQALAVISREMTDPIAAEFVRVQRDLGLGLSIEEALTNLQERIPSDDLGVLVAAISIQHRIGGNLGPLLVRVGQSIQQRARIRGQIRVLTAQVRMSAIVLCLLPVGVLLFLLLNPSTRSYSSVYTHFGLPMIALIFAGMLVISGYIIMRRFANVDM